MWDYSTASHSKWRFPCVPSWREALFLINQLPWQLWRSWSCSCDILWRPLLLRMSTFILTFILMLTIVIAPWLVWLIIPLHQPLPHLQHKKKAKVLWKPTRIMLGEHVGSDDIGGLSFEQRKRLSIALEFVASPSIILRNRSTSSSTNYLLHTYMSIKARV
jgi:hypothetical protein